jgi:hypothetical protein
MKDIHRIVPELFFNELFVELKEVENGSTIGILYFKDVHRMLLNSFFNELFTELVFMKNCSTVFALYFKDVESLKQIVNETMPERFSEVAKDMKRLAMEHYTWETIAAQYYSGNIKGHSTYFYGTCPKCKTKH